MARSKPLGDIRTHLMLLRTMAAETGTDTVLAFEDGRLAPEEWADAVTRCRHCGWAGACTAWLAEPEDRPRDIPAACANAHLLERVKAE